jgi:DNA-binding MarR family transcriptional regulator
MTRPFALAEEEATLAILRTADVLEQRAASILRPFEITPAQYNVLRILRGSPAGLTCGQISERLITHDADVTRLLDRMEARRWITRKRSGKDRRVVIVCLTAFGMKLLEEIKPFITAYHRCQFPQWGDKQLKHLLELLAKVRETKPQIDIGQIDTGETSHDQQIRNRPGAHKPAI